jgi:hypothetical protein
MPAGILSAIGFVTGVWLPVFHILASLRLIRVLMVCNGRSPNIRVVVHALYRAIPAITNVFAFCESSLLSASAWSSPLARCCWHRRCRCSTYHASHWLRHRLLTHHLPAVLLRAGMLFWLIFGILGVNLFKGKFSTCNDAEVQFKANCTGEFFSEDKVGLGPLGCDLVFCVLCACLPC